MLSHSRLERAGVREHRGICKNMFGSLNPQLEKVLGFAQGATLSFLSSMIAEVVYRGPHPVGRGPLGCRARMLSCHDAAMKYTFRDPEPRLRMTIRP